MNLFEHDSMNWTFLNMTQWIEPSLTWLEELNFFSKKKDSKNWFFFWAWLKELNLFLSMSQRIGFLSFCQKNDSKNWKFFFQYDSKNWTFLFIMTQRLFFTKKKLKEFDFLWLTDLNLLFKIFPHQKKTRRIDPIFIVTLKMFFFLKYEYDSQNWIFFLNTIQRSEILQYDSEDSTFFSDMTQSIELFLYDSLDWSFFKKYDLTHRMEPLFMNLFSRWLKELKSFFLSHRIELFFFFEKMLKELKSFFSECLIEFNLSFMWTIFLHDSKNFTFFSMWLKELNLVLNMIQRFFSLRLKELNLLLFDSKNWALF